MIFKVAEFKLNTATSELLCTGIDENTGIEKDLYVVHKRANGKRKTIFFFVSRLYNHDNDEPLIEASIVKYAAAFNWARANGIDTDLLAAA